MTARAYCGRGNDADAEFCVDCGKPVAGNPIGLRAPSGVGALQGTHAASRTTAIILALLDESGQPVEGCDWARRAVTSDPTVRSYAALSQSRCRP